MDLDLVESLDSHARLHVIDDIETGVTGVIAIHSTALGPAIGGCRLWHYESTAALTEDAQRLARGMSYKNALAGLPFGGGKAVLQKPHGTFNRATMFRVLGETIEALGGDYITAEDVGTSTADMEVVAQNTRYVAGLPTDSDTAGGDPSPWTALGVFEAMRTAARTTLQAELDDLTVAIQGTGNVGAGLCRLLKAAGARLVLADINAAQVGALGDELGARVVSIDEIMTVEADVLAPCALGGILNANSIPRLNVRLITGGANNQLATPEDAERLRRRGIVYAPDYVVNAGGIINVAAEYLGENGDLVAERVHRIPDRLREVIERAEREDVTTAMMADEMARQIIAQGSGKRG